MPPENRDKALLQDMLDASRAARGFVANRSFEDYVTNELLRSAVERKIEIVGEAARNVSDPTVDANPQIAWRKIRATRHILAHDYGRIDDTIVWRIATVHLPELIAQLQPLITAT